MPTISSPSPKVTTTELLGSAPVQQASTTTPTASTQPYQFVPGEPAPDASHVPSGTSVAGMPAPTVAPELWPTAAGAAAAEVGALDLKYASAISTQASLLAMQDIFIQLMMHLRTQSLENRDTELKTMVKEKTLSIEKNLEAAKQEMWASITTGIGQIASGSAGLIGGFKGETASAMGAQGKWTNFGSMLNGTATIASAGQTYEAAKTKKEAQEADLRAEVAQARMSQESERAANHRDALKTAMDSQAQIQRDSVEATKRVYA